MASGTLPASSSTPQVEHERYIERQLNKTRRQVKLVELGVAAVTLVVGVLAFFLVAAVIDHWLLPLGTFGRFALLAVLVAGLGWFGWSVLLPLVRNSINPAYAALAIEQSAPSLKNSLINFLMLRSHRGDVHAVVYDAIEERAASDLAGVPLDTVIDYGKLIKIGYVLAAIFAICAAYKVFSPKDPLQTIARVAAPWADIARPSRVQISDVQPGDAEQFFGDIVEVSAAIRGTRSTDSIVLKYSTGDGQTVDQTIEMQLDAAGARYVAQLPADGRGLSQDVIYRIEAGDATSREHRLTVIAAPTIVVEKLEYDYPRYTQRPRETRARQGDIRALEGTRVTISARANQPIHAAYIEFDPESSQREAGQTRQRIAMQASGMEATGTLILELQADRATPKYTTYQVTFVTTAGHEGKQPALHTIDIIRDLPPEVEILAPAEPTIEVPENGEVLVEIRGVDPDYALTRTGIKLTSAGKELGERNLLTSAGHIGQSVSKFKFRPSEFKLKAGDEVAYWATAADNRTAPKTSLPEPNTARTKNKFFKIIAADQEVEQMPPEGQNDKPMEGDPQPMPGENPMNERPMNMPPMDNGDQPMQQQPGQEGNAEQTSEKPSEKPMPGEKPMEKPPKNKTGEEGDGAAGGASEGTTDKPMEGAPMMPPQESQDGGGKEGMEPGAAQEQPMPEGSGEQPRDATKPPMNNVGNSTGEGNATDMPQDAGGKTGMRETGQPNTGENATEQPENSTESNPSGSNTKPGANGSDNKGQPENTPRENPHDGEVFEKALERMLEQAAKEQQSGNKSPMQNPGPQPTQEQIDKLPEHLKEKLREFMKKQAENQSLKDSAQGGLKGDEAEQQTGEQENPPTGESAAGEKPETKKPMEASGTGRDKKQGVGANNERGMGETGQPNEAATTKPNEKSTSDEPMSDEKRQGGMGTNGDAGAGRASTDKEGAAEAQEANRDKPKTMKTSPQSPSEDKDPQSPSGSKKQSDSEGGESGDQSGGGKKGPGQRTDAAGNDSAGSNSSANEGAGRAQESGDGETGEKAGNKKEAKGPTGQQGTAPGEGSSTKKSDQGDRTGQSDAPGEQSKEQNENPMPQGLQDGDARGKSGDFVTGGGKPSDNTGRSKFADAEGPAAEKAKLDYAKNATDLVLEYLKDQQDKPDQKLLDDLGWSQEDLKQFLARWEAAQRDAAKNPSAKGELDEALRSLGLRPGADKLRRGEAKSDKVRGLGDVGPTGGPPSKYEEQFRAFKKGAARGN